LTITEQRCLSDAELHALLDAYRAQYRVEYDEVLRQFEHKTCFDREDVDVVATWKFGSWPQRLARTRNLLAKNSDRDIENLTARAFRCNDDLGALLLIELLVGVGKALGSAILMAHEPRRYTVIDVNAARAIHTIGYLRNCPRRTDRNRGLPNWDHYLAAVRDIAARTGWTLRDVDRALYCAGRERFTARPQPGGATILP
jgi:hypothetical protein